MAGLIATIMEKPWVAHLLRASQRFGLRLGTQFAAAMAYFSILALVPVALFALTVMGYVVEVRPEFEPVVRDALNGAIGLAPGDTSGALNETLTGFLTNYRSVGLVAILTALYAGSGWVGNLKRAVRAQWRPKFDTTEPPLNIVLDTLVNVGLLIVLLLLVGITVSLTAVTTALNDVILDALGLADVTGIDVISRVVTIAATIAFGFLLFAFIYWIFPTEKVPRKAWLRGSLAASIGLAAVQFGATGLFAIFNGNPTAKALGPIIVLLLVLNIFATLILFVAAWIATSDQLAVAEADNGPAVEIDAPVQGPAMPPRLQSGQRYAARVTASPVDGEIPWVPGAGQPFVTQEVAKKSLRLGIGAGWITGVGAGVGIGATIAAAVTGLTRRRKKH